MKLLSFLLFTLTVAAGTAGAAQADGQKPIRHLVYNFDVMITNSTSQQSYSGTTNSSANDGDRGQIVADVLAVQPDTGLVVQISENARNTRSADPVECVTYGNGQFVCETGKKVNEEEYTLLRLIGRNFVNTAQIDAKNHWSYGISSADTNEKSDYTISSSKNGVLTISLARTLKYSGPQGYTATTQGQLTYDQNMSLPVKDSEDTITRYEGGQSYTRLESQINLSLASDSMAAASH